MTSAAPAAGVPAPGRAALVGIVNLTGDSFSDGGRFLDPRAAIEHGERLLAEGADWLDLGAESSNPAGQGVPVATQIERLRPVLQHFVAHGAQVAIDTHRPEVMRAALDLGAGMINDITALADPAAVALLADVRVPRVPIVIMHARNPGARAQVMPGAGGAIVAEVIDFFRARVAALAAAGIAPDRLILDPGMGFFLGSNPEPSLAIMKGLAALVAAPALQRPIYVSCSRKSFIGHLTGQPPQGRGPGTLAAELWALASGVSYLRTHDVRAIAEARRVWLAIALA
jgi:dihydropteroate synthase type 2